MRTTFNGTRPAWLTGSEFVQSSGRQVDWDLIPDSYKNGAVTVTLGADAAQNATTVTLNVPTGTTLSKGTVLDFGGGKFARLTQSVVGNSANHAGLTVDALVNNITSGDKAYVGGSGPKFVKSGTILAALASGKAIPQSLVVKAYSAARTADAGNTGNGVMTLAGTPTVANVQPGAYRVVMVEPGSDVGTFVVYDPHGVEIGTGVVAVAFSKQIAFTIADGATDFIAGDAFTVTVTETEDGGTCAGLILTDATEHSLTDAVSGYGCVIGGTALYENLLPDAVGGNLTAAQKAALASIGIGFAYEQYVDTRGS